MSDCIFCNSTLTKSTRSKEHVWPVWLLEDLDLDGVLYQTDHLGSFLDQRVISSRVHSINSLVQGRVCKNCNNGWMSDLESESSTLIRDLLSVSGGIYHLNETKCRAMARWAFKTAIVINTSSNYRPIIPKTQISQFYDSLSLPELMKIDLCLSRIDGSLDWLQDQSGEVEINRSTSNKALKEDFSKLFVFTLKVSGILFRLVWLPKAKYKVRHPKPKFSQRIYPYSGSIIKLDLSERVCTYPNFHWTRISDARRKKRTR